MNTNTNTKAFFELVRAGLWGEADANFNLNANDNFFEGVEWEKIYQRGRMGSGAARAFV